MLMMMDCSNRKPPVDLSGVVVSAAAGGAVPPSPEPAVAGTWHPHVYGNPPRTPTAHNIADILVWTCGKTAAGTDEQPLNLSTAKRPNGTVLDLTKIKRKGAHYRKTVYNNCIYSARRRLAVVRLFCALRFLLIVVPRDS